MFNVKKHKIIALITIVIGTSMAYYYLKNVDIFERPRIETTNLPDVGQDNITKDDNYNIYCFKSLIVDKKLLQPNTKYKLVSWNIHKGNDQNWDHQLKKYASQSDFLLLQEATTQNKIPQLLSHLKDWFSIHAGTFSYKGIMSGVLLLSAYPTERYCVASEEEPWIRIPKILEAAYYSLSDGASLLIINVHLVNFEWNPNSYEKQLKAMFEIITKHHGAIILAGDFNSWNAARMNLINYLVTAYGMREVPFKPDQRSQFMRNPLDHIFVRDVNIINAWTENTDTSDHNPLFLEFSLSEK